MSQGNNKPSQPWKNQAGVSQEAFKKNISLPWVLEWTNVITNMTRNAVVLSYGIVSFDSISSRKRNSCTNVVSKICLRMGDFYIS